MGPRSADRGNSVELATEYTDVRLQWGRDQLIAEMSQIGGPSRHTLKLQWGRDQLIAEMCRNGRRPLRSIRLQWGRDQLIAEIVGLAACRAPDACVGFNGAAIS